MTRKGRFIVFEGINGCGKGTQMQLLAEYIYGLSRDRTIFITREPNEFDENGRKTREILASDKNPYEKGLEAVNHFAWNRTTHNRIFVPMLYLGIDVLSDRYYHSNFAFQHTQGISYEDIARANKPARIPDLTFILDVKPKEAARRLKKRDGGYGRKFDSHLDFMMEVFKNYESLGRILPGLMGDMGICYINGMQPAEDVWKEVRAAFDSKFKKE